MIDEAKHPELAEPIHEDAHLEGLDERFLAALGLRRQGDVDGCADELREILKVEPRLAEPHLELANLLLDLRRHEEARAHAEEAVRLLESGDPWLADPPPHVLRSLAWGVLGESLRVAADSDEVVFGEPERFVALMAQARSAFSKAAALDASNEHAVHWSLHLKDPSPGGGSR